MFSIYFSSCSIFPKLSARFIKSLCLFKIIIWVKLCFKPIIIINFFSILGSNVKIIAWFLIIIFFRGWLESFTREIILGLSIEFFKICRWKIKVLVEFFTFKVLVKFFTFKILVELFSFKILVEFLTFKVLVEFLTFKVLVEFLTFKILVEFLTFKVWIRNIIICIINFSWRLSINRRSIYRLFSIYFSSCSIFTELSPFICGACSLQNIKFCVKICFKSSWISGILKFCEFITFTTSF